MMPTAVFIKIQAKARTDFPRHAPMRENLTHNA
jgi:hypothetical protein